MPEPTYAEFVKSLSKPGQAIIDGLTPTSAHCLHMALGVSSDAGELLDAIKKWAIYGKELNIHGDGGVVEERGDLEFFMEGLRQNLGITCEEVIANNRVKLGKRYESLTYSDAAAVERKDKQP